MAVQPVIRFDARRLVACSLAALTLAGCGDRHPTGPRWQLSENPLLEIGTTGGEGPEAFGRIAGVVRLSDGRIVVADQMTLHVTFFAPDGQVLIRTGGRGEGPGEYRTIMTIRRCGADSVAVYDPAFARLTVYDGEGNRAATRSVGAGNAAPPYDFFCSSRLLAFVHRSPDPPPGIGPRRPTVVLSVVGRNESTPTEVDSVPASERYFDGSNDFPRPLGKETSVAVGDSVIYVGTGDRATERSDSFSIRTYSLGGEPGPPVRDRFSPRAIEPRHVRAYLSERFDRGSGPGRAEFRDRLESIEYAEFFPAHGRILLDGEQHLWVEEYHVPGERDRRWRQYGLDGTPKAILDVPGSLRLHQIDGDRVLGIYRDHLGVEFVRVHAIEGPAQFDVR